MLEAEVKGGVVGREVGEDLCCPLRMESKKKGDPSRCFAREQMMRLRGFGLEGQER